MTGLSTHRQPAFFMGVLALLLASLNVNADEVPAIPGTDARSADRAELQAVKKVYEDAVASGDLSALKPYFTADTTGVVVENKEFKSVDELQKIYDDLKALLGPGMEYKVKVNFEPSTFVGDLAISHGTCDEYVRDSAGHEFSYTSTWTAVLQKRDGQWKLLRSQVTMDPFQNPIVKFFVRKSSTTFGLGGLLLGLVAGIIGTRLLCRRAKPTQT